jgi:hypothetical protein
LLGGGPEVSQGRCPIEVKRRPELRVGDGGGLKRGGRFVTAPVAERLAGRLGLDDRPLRLLIQDERSLARNRHIAAVRLGALVAGALALPPPPRRPTRRQIFGAAAGVVIANLMFALPLVNISDHVRSSPNLWLGEVVATFGLLLVIFGLSGSGRTSAAPLAVGAYITGAYFFTSSTSFANPAVTIARTLSDTFAGIAPASRRSLPDSSPSCPGTHQSGSRRRTLGARSTSAR